MAKKRLKICCISSHGGHLHELQEALKDVDQNQMYWVTYKTKHTQMVLKDKRHYFIIDPVTSKPLFVWNAIQSLWHLIKERPNVMISTGAGMAFPSLLLGKYLLRAKLIYIESAAAVTEASKTGKAMYKYADLFLIQWEQLKEFYPKAKYVGLL